MHCAHTQNECIAAFASTNTMNAVAMRSLLIECVCDCWLQPFYSSAPRMRYFFFFSFFFAYTFFLFISTDVYQS